MSAGKPRILLLNPPIYDFSAYDFWLKPYGLLRVGGWLRRQAELKLFDFMDRHGPYAPEGASRKDDRWGRGHFAAEVSPKPPALADITRHWRRYGAARARFREFLAAEPPFDFALVQTMMTYWVAGVREITDDLRAFSPRTKIVFGGVWATLCQRQAAAMGADLIVSGSMFEALWPFLGMTPELTQPPFWEGYDAPNVGVLKLTDGCPFHCTYCAARIFHPQFRLRATEEVVGELDFLLRRGARHVAFYDDALLHQFASGAGLFFREVMRRNLPASFHSPNGLNARFLDAETARLLVAAGFKTFFLGFESASPAWRAGTGEKAFPEELARAVSGLVDVGVGADQITAYVMLGHPTGTPEDAAASLEFVSSLGIRSMLSEFSPVPGTVDGEASRDGADLNEPLNHNKTAFSIRRWGGQTVNELKKLCRERNRQVTRKPPADAEFD